MNLPTSSISSFSSFHYLPPQDLDLKESKENNVFVQKKGLNHSILAETQSIISQAFQQVKMLLQDNSYTQPTQSDYEKWARLAQKNIQQLMQVFSPLSLSLALSSQEHQTVSTILNICEKTIKEMEQQDLRAEYLLTQIKHEEFLQLSAKISEVPESMVQSGASQVDMNTLTNGHHQIMGQIDNLVSAISLSTTNATIAVGKRIKESTVSSSLTGSESVSNTTSSLLAENQKSAKEIKKNITRYLVGSWSLQRTLKAIDRLENHYIDRLNAYLITS